MDIETKLKLFTGWGYAHDIYLIGNQAEGEGGGWVYGIEEKNPTCPTLSYSFLEGKKGEKECELSDSLLESFENTYSENPKILDYTYHQDYYNQNLPNNTEYFVYSQVPNKAKKTFSDINIKSVMILCFIISLGASFKHFYL